MEKTFENQLSYMQFLKDEISSQIPNLDASQVKNRLKQYCENLDKLDELKNSYVEQALRSDEGRNMALEWVETQRPKIKSLAELKNTIEEVLKGLEVTEHQNSLKNYEKMEFEKLQLAIETEKRLAEVKKKLNASVNDDLAKLIAERNEAEGSLNQQSAQISLSEGRGAIKPNVKLQKLSISPFYGETIDYLRFSAQFNTEIDQSSLDEVSKLNYLLSLTKGKPRDEISGLPHNAEGYQEAKRILEQKYGKDCVVFKTLVLELEKLPSIRNLYQKKEINDFSRRFSKIVRTLKTMGKLSSVEGNVHSVFSKLGPLRECLAAASDDWESWSLSQLAEKLENYVERNNLTEKWSNDSKTDKSSQRYNQAERPNEPYRNSRFDKSYYSDHNNEGKWRSENKNNQCDKSKMFYNQDNKTSENKNKCAFCGYFNHVSKNCLKVLDLAKRREIAQSKKLCFLCLKEGHLASNCKSKKCEKCNGGHHIAICDRSEKTSIPAGDVSEKSMGMLQRVGSIHPAALININGIKARILFDTGSSLSFISTRLITSLGLKPHRNEFKSIEQLYGLVRRRVEIYKIQIKSLVLDYEINVEVANSNKEILTYLPNFEIKSLKSKYPRIKNLKFSDEEATGESLPVDIILGARDFNKMKIAEPPIILKENDLVVEMTKLGWIISGGGNRIPPYDENSFFLSSEEQFDAMTKIDLLGISEDSDNNVRFHEDFMKKLKQNESGRYVAPLPWKQGIVDLPQNKKIALNRLRKNTDRLAKIDKLEAYDAIMREQIEMGILEKVPNSDSTGRVHYIPHQAVIKENSESTKVRVVYDCSSKSKTGEPSLNDCLESGPPLQPKLFDILMRVRSFKFLLTGDICKAFHQICLAKQDIDVQRLFWYSDLKNRVIEEYRFTRVIFGCTSSPYILGATMQRHVSQFTDKYPETTASLLTNTYVDDILFGGSVIKDLEKFKIESTKIMSEAKMELHKWHSNAESLEIESASRPDDDRENAKILGMTWNKTLDTISINLWAKEAREDRITKRNILSFVHSIYDLLGLASPITIIGKVIFGKTCLKKLSWDQQVPEDIAQEWIKYVQQLKQCPVITFPRYIMTDEVTQIEMHGFSDASFTAVCAMVYIVWRENENTKSFLLVSKSRVAPKKTSVPRLELMAALMLSRLISHCKGNLQKISFYKTVAWTDSTTVLFWLESKGTYSRYVRNRVDKINEIELKWQYCPTKDNPADMGSRGCLPNQLGDLWFYGPKWVGDNKKWPEQPDIAGSKDSESELVKQKVKDVSLMGVVSVQEGPLHHLLQKPYMRMLRVTAYVFRFIYRGGENAFLTTEELEKSERFWIRLAQRDINMEIEQNNLKQKDGIYYIDGRILGYNPIFIPRTHPLAKSLTISAHQRTLHGGASTIMAHIRKRFWIPQLRVLAKSVVYNCEKCKRYRVKALAPPKTGKLPLFRTEFSPPFTVVGVDFAGPLIYKIGPNENLAPDNNKCYIALFTCAITRAVYLKLCRSQTQEEFRHVLKEFVTRRGIPKTIVSDNAKTFISTSEWLKLLKTDNDLNNYVIREGIKWKFNMSRAPWWGGFFERLIGITKRALSKTIGRGYLSFQELEDVLFDIENFMNNRPITYQGEELEKPALTPNTFLRGTDSVSLEEDLDKLDDDLDLSRRLTHIQRCKNNLRYRWQDEYLHALQERHKIKLGSSDKLPSKGAIVLLKEDIKDRAQWRIARITKELTGKDNQTRGYELKLGNGYTIQRPVQLVCPLELQAEVREDLEKTDSIQPERDRPKRTAKSVAGAKIKVLSENEDFGTN